MGAPQGTEVPFSKPSKKIRPSDWIPAEAFVQIEGLGASDIIRLCELGLLPRTQTIDTQVWVHEPTTYDWRELIRTSGFVPLAEALAHGR
jgi:hypothetical protein